MRNAVAVLPAPDVLAIVNGVKISGREIDEQIKEGLDALKFVRSSKPASANSIFRSIPDYWNLKPADAESRRSSCSSRK